MYLHEEFGRRGPRVSTTVSIVLILAAMLGLIAFLIWAARQ